MQLGTRVTIKNVFWAVLRTFSLPLDGRSDICKKLVTCDRRFNVGLRIIVSKQWDDSCIPFTSNVEPVNDATVPDTPPNDAIREHRQRRTRLVSREPVQPAAPTAELVLVVFVRDERAQLRDAAGSHS